MKRTIGFLACPLTILLIFSAFLYAKSAKRPVSRADVVPSQDTLTLAYPGPQTPVPYEKYGDFIEVGTKGYRYVIKDKKGLAQAAGQGVFPNRDVYKDPAYRKLKKDKD